MKIVKDHKEGDNNTILVTLPAPLHLLHISNCQCLTVILDLSSLCLLRNESEILMYKKNINVKKSSFEEKILCFQVYKFFSTTHFSFYSLSPSPNSVSGHGNASYGRLKENHIFLFFPASTQRNGHSSSQPSRDTTDPP